MFFIRQSATHKVVLGPAVAVGDGFTPVTNLDVATADEAEAILHDNGTVIDISGYTWDAIATADGYYHLTLHADISGTVGHMTVVVNDDSLCLPLRADFTVLEEAAYDVMYAASATGPLQATTGGRKLDVTATGEAGLDFDNTSGTIDAAQLGADCITAAKIADDAIAAEHIAAGAIVAATFAANAITSTVVADNAITAAKLNADCITAAKIADDAISAEHINTGALTADAFAADALVAATFATGAFTADAFAANALVAATFAADFITAAKIANDAIGDEHWNVTRVVANTDQIEGGDATDAINAACDASIETYKLDHLILSAAAEDEVADNSVIARLAATEGDWSEYNDESHSLEAIRVRGDAEWTTGAGGSDRLLMVDTTIATLATQVSFTLAAGSTDNDAYNNCTIVIEDASTATQKAVGIVSAYTGASKTVTLKYDPGIFTMQATDKVYILAENALKSTAANRQLDVNATGEAGLDFDNTSGTIDEGQLGGDCITSAKIADGAFVADNFAASSLNGKGDWNTTTPPTADANADAVWDEELTGASHNDPTSAGRRLRQVEQTSVLTDGTAQAGANGTITLAAGESDVTDFYQHAIVVIIDGTGIGQARAINGYDGGTKVATVVPNWATNPANGSGYTILADTEKHVYEVHTGGIDSGSFAAGAIDAAAIAANAITSSEIADGALTAGTFAASSLDGKGDWNTVVPDAAGVAPTAAEVVNEWETQSQADPTGFHVNVLEVGGTNQTAGDIIADTNDIQSRLPAALASGRMSSDSVAISGSTDAADKLEASAETIVADSVDTGYSETTTTFKGGGTATLSAVNDHYNGRIVIFTSGTLANQATDITDYDGSTKVFTVTALTSAPADGVTFNII